MANRTDPLISQVSGSDPQNLMEYLTRQRIYDSRYWKETCFGLTVTNVLEESTVISATRGAVAIGHLNFLALTLKLLQLHPDLEMVMESFCEQDQFKYTRALGALYVRLTGRPADIYTCLEGLYTDVRRLRRYTSSASTPKEAWTNEYHMDEYIHDLLTESHVAGIAMPRLPLRTALQEAGYLPAGPRPTGLQSALEQYGDPLSYLKHKALVEQSEKALELWNLKYAARYQKKEKSEAQETAAKEPDKKKAKMGDRLFKKQPQSSFPTTAPAAAAGGGGEAPQEGSDEYWNDQRAKLGLAPLRN